MTEPAERRSEIVAPEDVTQRYTLEQTRMSLESGFLGKFFGSATNAPTNIHVAVARTTIAVRGINPVDTLAAPSH